MNKLVSLEKINGNKALLLDLEKENKTYEVKLNDNEVDIYQNMLDQAEEEELENEETGVLVFYNNNKNKLEFKESDL